MNVCKDTSMLKKFLEGVKHFNPLMFLFNIKLYKDKKNIKLSRKETLLLPFSQNVHVSQYRQQCFI